MLLALAIAFATAGVAVAASVNFGGGTISFPTANLSFSSASLAFPSGSIAFPSSLMATETAASVEVTLPADVLFDFDKAEIRPRAESTMHEIAEMVRARARGPVVIKGYTDALGKDAYNQALSERRANAVKAWLAKREGLVAVAFRPQGFGARDPVAPNRSADGSDNPEGRQLNRRVVIFMPK